jgi:hypothetical protein
MSASRCGLGQTSPHPLLTTIENFPEVYAARVRKDVDYESQFDLRLPSRILPLRRTATTPLDAPVDAAGEE